MDYSIATMALEIHSVQLPRVRQLLDCHFPFDGRTETASGRYEKLRNRIYAELPMLHFFGIMIFEDQHYDPLLAIQINVDGDIGPFWTAIEASFGDELRALIRCSKRPRNREAPLFDTIVADGSTTPLAPYLSMKTRRPVTDYRGARRFSRDRIVSESLLYERVQKELGNGIRWKGQSARAINQTLREKFRAEIKTLSRDPHPWKASFVDWAKLALLVLALLATITITLGATTAILSLILGPGLITSCIIFAIVTVSFLWRKLVKDGRPVPQPRLRSILLFASIGVSVIGAWSWLGTEILVIIYQKLLALKSYACIFVTNDMIAGYLSCLEAAKEIRAVAFPHILNAFLGGLLTLAILVIWLRRLESTDATHDGVKLPNRMMKGMRSYEDWGMQNQMCSLLTVKPGILRTIILRVSHLLLSRLARTLYTNGVLGSMRTIHFAHWAVLNRDGRLIFFSNFDGSWESYLNDFTEKASFGVNLAWSQCLGFPPNMYVILGGSALGRQFKAWARHSMTQSCFWYSAYPHLSVEMIHRNARVAAGLASLHLEDADAWARDL